MTSSCRVNGLGCPEKTVMVLASRASFLVCAMLQHVYVGRKQAVNKVPHECGMAACHIEAQKSILAGRPVWEGGPWHSIGMGMRTGMGEMDVTHGNMVPILGA
jgi:hypothetical protein